MITFLYGTYGSGKTTHILEQIAEDTAKGIHTFLMVPEQEAVLSERKTLERLPPSSQLSLEVLNFSRLYNRVCREYGNLSYRYITKPLKSLLMWQNLRELSPLLEQYGGAEEKDPTFGEIMLRAIGELKACAILPSDLEKAANKLRDKDPLRGRLRDLALIYASFDSLVSQNYSDSADDLSRLRDLLDDHSFFEGCHIYIDSFTSYTAVEHQIIERMFAQAESVTVTIPLSDPNDSDMSAEGIRKSLLRLRQAAQRRGGYRELILRQNQRAQSPALAYLVENLWKLDVSDEEGNAFSDDSILLESCDTPYAEAEAAASHILALLRRGVRAREIVVIARDAEQYHGIIEPALERAGIPFFFSEKSDLCTTPPIKLLLTALRIKQYNWRRSDVIAHIKTGLCDLSDTEADLFEEYINTWNINGARFLGEPFSMNPDGYTDRLTERGKSILATANQAKISLCEPLNRLFILLDGACGIADMCRAVYRYMEEIHLEDKLIELSRKELARGEKKQAEETASLYGILMQTLADIAGALGDEEATTEEFTQLLRIAFAETSIGTIPTSVDEVTVGSASMLRVADPKYALILGLREGEFPAAVKERSLLSSTDRVTLAELGIELSATDDVRSSDELMYVRRAFAAPSHGLYLFTSLSDTSGEAVSPSIPFLRAKKLFSNIKSHTYVGSDFHYLTPSPKNAVAHLRELKGSDQGATLAEALMDFIPDVKEKSIQSTSQPDCSVEPALIAKRMGEHSKLSPTAFETYVQCPFDYACTYFLSLRDKKEAAFRADSMGSFVHFILEKTVREALTADKNGILPNGESLFDLTQKASQEFIQTVCPPDVTESGKMRHLYHRLNELAYLLVCNIATEFQNSDFHPAFYELNINGKDGNPTPLALTLSDGSTVSLSGKVDRVDVLEKDGEIYLRVVDYKTGDKTFRLEDAQNGLNTQMLFYLFTLCQSDSPAFRKSIGVKEGKKPLPAGVVYLSFAIDTMEVEDDNTVEATLAKAAASLKRSGLLLRDEEILTAMNHSLSSHFLVKGVKKKADGTLAEKALASAEEIEALCKQLESIVTKIADKMRSGYASANPCKEAEHSPCEYCSKKPICRRQSK